MAGATESQTRTRTFARVLGPWLVLIPGIIAMRVQAMAPLAADFFKSDLFVWFAGALLVFGGLLIIAFHQYWRSPAAVILSVVGWIMALRGVLLLTVPQVYKAAGNAVSTATPMGNGPRRRASRGSLLGSGVLSPSRPLGLLNCGTESPVGNGCSSFQLRGLVIRKSGSNVGGVRVSVALAASLPSGFEGLASKPASGKASLEPAASPWGGS